MKTSSSSHLASPSQRPTGAFAASTAMDAYEHCLPHRATAHYAVGVSNDLVSFMDRAGQ